MPGGEWKNIATMGQPKQTEHHDRMFDLSMRIGELTASVKSLEKVTKDDAERIQDAFENLASEIFKSVRENSERMDRIERMLAEREAETRGMMKAMRWGGVALTALGSGLGWVMATWGNAITSALGFGGPPNGGK